MLLHVTDDYNTSTTYLSLALLTKMEKRVIFRILVWNNYAFARSHIRRVYLPCRRTPLIRLQYIFAYLKSEMNRNILRFFGLPLLAQIRFRKTL